MIYAKGEIIHSIPAEAAGKKVFHAGTTLSDPEDPSSATLTCGGRVLCATALGDTVQQAQENAYALVKSIEWDTAYYRNDIGYRAINRSE